MASSQSILFAGGPQWRLAIVRDAVTRWHEIGGDDSNRVERVSSIIKDADYGGEPLLIALSAARCMTSTGSYGSIWIRRTWCGILHLERRTSRYAAACDQLARGSWDGGSEPTTGRCIAVRPMRPSMGSRGGGRTCVAIRSSGAAERGLVDITALGLNETSWSMLSACSTTRRQGSCHGYVLVSELLHYPA